MKVLKWIIIVLAIILGFLALLPMFLAPSYEIRVSETINMPKEMVYSKVTDYRTWKNWSVWNSMEEEVEYKYEIKPTGEVGNQMSWTGDTVGVGTIEIVEAQEPNYIDQKLTFKKPFEMTGRDEWKFEEVENGTKVTWINSGEYKYFERFFGVMMEMSGQLESQMEEGLQNLKNYLEGQMEVRMTSVEDLKFYSIATQCMVDGVKDELTNCYGKLSAFYKENGQEFSGAPFTVSHDMTEKGEWIFEACLPANEQFAEGNEEIEFKTVSYPKVLEMTYVGPYEKMAPSYNYLMEYMAKNNMVPAGYPMEIYIDDPEEVAPEDLKTLIQWPVMKKGEIANEETTS